MASDSEPNEEPMNRNLDWSTVFTAYIIVVVFLVAAVAFALHAWKAL